GRPIRPSARSRALSPPCSRFIPPICCARRWRSGSHGATFSHCGSGWNSWGCLTVAEEPVVSATTPARGGMRRASLFALCSLLTAAPAAADDFSTAVLSPADARAYRAAFEEQSAGHAAKADAALKRVSDPVLMGYVLEERYLGHGYVSKFAELNDWLKRY